MIAIDTNLLVYASRTELAANQASFRSIAALVDGPERWALPWPCLAEFLCVVTNQRIFSVPTPVEVALDQVDAWIDAGPVLLAETARTWDYLRELVTVTELSGPRVYDARIAAICLDHEVRELWTADGDFSRFPKLRTHNPLTDLLTDPTDGTQ